MSSNTMFRRAERTKAKLRCGMAGPSGSGKTYSALLLAFGLGGKVALIDTENGSGDLYASLGTYDVCRIQAPFMPDKYISAIKDAEASGYDVIIIDSLSHAWAGEGGLLDMQGKIADSGKGNSYTAWRTVTPKHNALVEAMLQSKAHVIATMRSKTEYVQQKDEKSGKTEIKKVGMAPIQRDGMEYEFTVMFDLSIDHTAVASKDRTSLFDGRYIKPSPAMGKELGAWLNSGKDAPALAKPAPAAESGKPEEATKPATDQLAAAQKEEAFAGPITEPQKKKMLAGFNELGVKDREDRLSRVRTILGRQNVMSVKDLDKDEAGKVISALEHELELQRRKKAVA